VRSTVLVALVLLGIAAQPLSAQQATAQQKQTLAFPVGGPADIFLLKADGSPFKDEKGRYRGELSVPPYTSRLNLIAVVNDTGAVLEAELPGTDPLTHGVSDDRPVLTLEVDGTPLRDGSDFDSVIATLRRKGDRLTRISLLFKPSGLQKVLSAKERVAIKVRLRSDAFASAGECERASPGSAAAEGCRKPYTGRTLEGKNLVRLKSFFGPATRSTAGG
jgi:hypothetical protein